MKHIVVFLLACVLLALLAPGCDLLQEESGIEPEAEEIQKQPDIEPAQPQGSPPSAPSPSITVELSFPDGAPPLNQTRALRGTIKTPGMIVETGISLKIELPEAFELVRGELSWSGRVPEKSSITVINVIIKSTKVGNWTIDETHQISEPKSFAGTGYGRLYVAVSEDSAEWGKYPPWYGESSPPVPVKPVPLGVPAIIDFTISHPPVLNEPAQLTLTVLPGKNLPNATVKITLPEGAALLDGNLEWRGDLETGVPVTISVQIAFGETGDWRIDGGFSLASSVDGLLGIYDSIYLSIGVDQSAFAKPTEPGVLPPPPSVSP